MILDIIIFAVLAAIAIFLLILELFFLPGLSVAGFFSIVFYGVALYYAFTQMGMVVGTILLIFTIFLTIFVIWYFMRSRTLDKMSLHTNIDATAPTTIDSNIHVGDKGITISRLNPMGRVRIGNITAEARAIDFIEENVPVIITKIERTTIYVEPSQQA
ncbi:MAG: NfeD family protein [Bacteroidaceae bacterium]|nr:NfeD family protein [Bacteroidaceae bacterium]